MASCSLWPVARLDPALRVHRANPISSAAPLPCAEMLLVSDLQPCFSDAGHHLSLNQSKTYLFNRSVSLNSLGTGKSNSSKKTPQSHKILRASHYQCCACPVPPGLLVL